MTFHEAESSGAINRQGTSRHPGATEGETMAIFHNTRQCGAAPCGGKLRIVEIMQNTPSAPSAFFLRSLRTKGLIFSLRYV